MNSHQTDTVRQHTRNAASELVRQRKQKALADKEAADAADVERANKCVQRNKRRTAKKQAADAAHSLAKAAQTAQNFEDMRAEAKKAIDLYKEYNTLWTFPQPDIDDQIVRCEQIAALAQSELDKPPFVHWLGWVEQHWKLVFTD